MVDSLKGCVESIAADDRAVRDIVIVGAVVILVLFIASRICLGFPDTTLASKRVSFAETTYEEEEEEAYDPLPAVVSVPAADTDSKYAMQVLAATLNKRGQRMCSIMALVRMATKPPRHCQAAVSTAGEEHRRARASGSCNSKVRGGGWDGGALTCS